MRSNPVVRMMAGFLGPRVSLHCGVLNVDSERNGVRVSGLHRGLHCLRAVFQFYVARATQHSCRHSRIHQLARLLVRSHRFDCCVRTVFKYLPALLRRAVEDQSNRHSLNR